MDEARGTIEDGGDVERTPLSISVTPVALTPISVRPPASAAPSVGKYRFIAALGHGGMADVYLAVAVGPAGFNKLLVIKRLRQSLDGEPDFRAMFLDEARLAARLNHRNVVQTNEVGVEDDQYFIAMEYLDGQPLNRVFARARQVKSAVPLGLALHMLCDVLAGLQYAHDLTDYDGAPLRVVHRDISPQNVFVTYDGQTKIVDFGIAKAARRMVETQVGVIKGKVSYMAPEQAFSPSSEIDGRADVFSVGVMLWEAIAGKRLWQGLADPEIISNMLKEMPRVRDEVPGVLPELAAISERALARDREDRFPSAAALRAALEPCIEKLGEKVTTEEVGAYVRSLFVEQRADLLKVIDRQLAALDESPETRREPKSHNAPLPEIRNSLPPPAESYPPLSQQRTPADGSTPSEGRNSTFRGAVIGAVAPPPASVSSRWARLYYASIAAALLAAGTATWLLAARPPEPPRPEPTIASETPPPPSSRALVRAALDPAPAAAPDGYLHARLTVTPPEARILVDGAALPSTPFEGKFLKDGAVHRIQVEAPGFLTQSRLAVFDKDLSLDITLQLRPKTVSEGAPAEVGGPKPDPYGLSPR